MKFKSAEKIIAPNDKQTKRLFSYSENDYKFLLNGGTMDVTESKTAPVDSPLKLKLSTSPNPTEEMFKALDEFDRAVLSACISEWLAGNKVTTPAVIFRAVCGKSTAYLQSPTEKQVNEILKSVNKMAVALISSDMSKVCEKFGYNGGKPLKIDFTPILPCRLEDGIFNHNPTRLIKLTAESPILRIAKAKGQLVTFDKALLNGGKIHNTRLAIAAKFYCLLRVLESIAHCSNLKPLITFADIYEKCRISDSSGFTKMKCRDSVLATFDRLVAAEILKSYEKILCGNENIAVKFVFKYRRKQKN